MKHRRRKKNRDLVTSRLVYTDCRRPEMRPEALVMDVHRGEVVDDGYAAAMVAMVAVRTGIPLNQVRIIAVDDVIAAVHRVPAEGQAIRNLMTGVGGGPADHPSSADLGTMAGPCPPATWLKSYPM